MWEDYKLRGKRFIVLKTMNSYKEKYFRGDRGIILKGNRYSSGNIQNLYIQMDSAKDEKRQRQQTRQKQKKWASGRLKIEII